MTTPKTALLVALLAAPAGAQTDSGDRQPSRSPEYGADALGASTERFLQEDGEALYLTVCAGCHQPQGTGAVGAGVYPPLAGNPMLEGSRYPAWIIVNGMAAMPSFGDWLSNAQVVEIVTYIQSNLGNDWETDLTAADVEDLREAPPSE
ncbi:c-type cytochrome [Roseicyclus sp.]|uniref:c-type cytochrome n=1 Tax=Roseicyclus sp. TaxID=1914329 RepID=UPI003FA05E7B